jgi:hypothetical protein
MSADWIERASHLIEQSRKTAASVVLGVAIAVATALYARATWPAFTQLAPGLQTTIAVVLFLGSYSVAVLVVGSAVSMVQAVRGLIIRKGSEKAQAHLQELEWDKRRRQIQAVLPELSTEWHYDFLSEFKSKNPGELPSATTSAQIQGHIVGDLERLGFIVPAAKLDSSRVLYYLTPAAASIVPPFLAERRRKTITSALERAGWAEKALLQLFAEPEPPDGEPRHERMRREVYSAIRPLVSSFVLTHEATARFLGGLPRGSTTETMSLTPEAIALVEEMILNGKVARTTVVLDLGNIEGTGSSGGGTRGVVLPPGTRPI